MDETVNVRMLRVRVDTKKFPYIHFEFRLGLGTVHPDGPRRIVRVISCFSLHLTRWESSSRRDLVENEARLYGISNGEER